MGGEVPSSSDARAIAAPAISGRISGPRAPVMRYYVMADYPDAGGRPCIVVLAGARWPAFLRKQAGIVGEPAYERPAAASEPQTFPNGHPFAWMYRDLEDLLRDEQRLLGPTAALALRSALTPAWNLVSKGSPGVPGHTDAASLCAPQEPSSQAGVSA